MTTKSPAETFGQQAEAVSGGKPMPWVETAARMMPLAAIPAGIGLAVYQDVQARAKAQAKANAQSGRTGRARGAGRPGHSVSNVHRRSATPSRPGSASLGQSRGQNYQNRADL